MSNCSQCFEKSLLYTSPAHGGWGMVRIGMMVPESLQLFVSPMACGRHGALGASVHGYRDRLAYHFLTEKDIISGDYEQQLFSSVAEFLERSSWKPRAFLIFVTCIDDLMGTDLDMLTMHLEEEFPGIDFSFCHMDPIMDDSKSSPALRIHQQIFRLLKPRGEKRPVANLIGNLVRTDEASDLFPFLAGLGITETTHISQCKSYDEFQQMASASYTFTLSPTAALAAKWMKQELGIPFLELPVSYRLETIAEQYEAIEAFVGRKSMYSLEEMRRTAEKEIAKTRTLLEGLPIYVDNDAVVYPYELAWALLEYGFHVVGIFADKPSAREMRYWELLQERGDVEIQAHRHPKTLHRSADPKHCMAIGFEAAYIVQSEFPVDLLSDETMYGYHSVIKLMRRMRECYQNPIELQNLIESYGLVV